MNILTYWALFFCFLFADPVWTLRISVEIPLRDLEGGMPNKSIGIFRAYFAVCLGVVYALTQSCGETNFNGGAAVNGSMKGKTGTPNSKIGSIDTASDLEGLKLVASFIYHRLPIERKAEA